MLSIADLIEQVRLLQEVRQTNAHLRESEATGTTFTIRLPCEPVRP
jgi:hypothetical protein